MIFQTESSSSSRVACGKVGNLILVFDFSRRGPPELWECGNLAGLARFPRGGGKSGKPGFGFPLFPRTRHFHSSFAAELDSPANCSLGPPRLGQQRQLGFLHLLRRLRITHTHRLPLQHRRSDARLQALISLRQRDQLFVRSAIILHRISALALALRQDADRRETTRAGASSDKGSTALCRTSGRLRHVGRRSLRSRYVSV